MNDFEIVTGRRDTVVTSVGHLSRCHPCGVSELHGWPRRGELTPTATIWPEAAAQWSRAWRSAMYHWNQNPSSRELPTMRSLSALYGLMRFEPNRKYKDGDPNDFLVAASAMYSWPATPKKDAADVKRMLLRRI